MTTLVAEGDSMTSIGPAPKWLDMLSSWDIFDFAWGGDRAAYMPDQYAGEAHLTAPWSGETGWFALWAGTNDLVHGTETAAQIFAHLADEWAAARADHYLVLAFTVLPSTILTPAREAVRVALNDLIAGATSSYDALVRPDLLFPTVTSTYFEADGVHLNPAGQSLVAQQVASILPPPDGVPTHVPVIRGTAGADTLVASVAGTHLIGGTGDDWYWVTGGSDRVWEGSSSGKDWLVTPSSYILQPHTEVEVIRPADMTGTAWLTLQGNELDQSIYGNAGNGHLLGGAGDDRIYGGSGRDVIEGGPGHDVLTGGGAGDTFIFAKGEGSDTIVDFTPVDDTIKLSGFSLPIGRISETAFYAGPAAHDGNDRVIYDQPHGALYYDADGSGSAAPVLIATLSGHPVLTLSDIWVVA